MHIIIILATIELKAFLDKSKFPIAVVIRLSFPIIPIAPKLTFT